MTKPTKTNWQQAVEEALDFFADDVREYVDTPEKYEECKRKYAQAIAKATGEHVIGRNDKPNTWVQRYPGSLSPGTKKSTKLSENEKSRNALRAEQRKELGIHE